MKRNDLKTWMKKAGVPEYLCNMTDTGRTDERFNIRKEGNRWNVFFCERGDKTTDLRFETEDEACQYVYELFVREINSGRL